MTNSFAYSLPGMTTTPESIVTVVADVYQVPFEIIYTKTAKRNIAEARGLSFFLIREILKLSLVKTGLPFNTDYSTVSYWAKNIIKLTKFDKCTREKFIQACHNLNIPSMQINEYLK